MCKHGFFFINSLKVSRNKACHPSTTVDQVWRPAKFLYRFQRSFTKEYRSQAIIFKPFFLVVGKNVLSFKEVLVVKKINLQAGIGQGSHLDLQGKVFIVNGNIDTGKPYHFMK